MAALDGFIYAIGGYDGTSRLSTVERYCPKTNRWTFVASLANATSKVFAVGLNGFLYAAGTITVYALIFSLAFLFSELSVFI